jgi:hypothetical protein
MSKVSIIIPAYNQARFLGRALGSALEQQGVDVEVIVVNDGSTDETPAVIARFQADPRLKCIHQGNAGLGAARNRGLAEATGDHVCFLDSDDFYDPQKCAKQAALLDADPELGFVYCDFVTVDENGAPKAGQGSINQLNRGLSGNIFPALALGGYFPPHTVMIRRAVLDAVGYFDLELGGHADYDLWLRAAATHRALYLDEKLASYRDYGDSMSKDGDHMMQTRRGALRKIARLQPDLAGEALHQLQQACEDVFHANQFLRETCDRAATAAPAAGGVPEGEQLHPFLKHLSRARLTQGRADQSAVWDVVLDGQFSKALLLQPPVEMVFDTPSGLAGVFSAEITIHPDAWEKPEAGACEYTVQIDRRIALAMVIDPVKLPSDRRWHPVRIEVPATPQGNHQVSLRTRSPNGANSYRWALWRNPRFQWNETAAHSAA